MFLCIIVAVYFTYMYFESLTTVEILVKQVLGLKGLIAARILNICYGL